MPSGGVGSRTTSGTASSSKSNDSNPMASPAASTSGSVWAPTQDVVERAGHARSQGRADTGARSALAGRGPPAGEPVDGRPRR